jgi:hypothetical protein
VWQAGKYGSGQKISYDTRGTEMRVKMKSDKHVGRWVTSNLQRGKRRNLNITLIDYQKAFDGFPRR